jgi:hypothetical protein
METTMPSVEALSSDYRRLEAMVMRFGLDAVPEPARYLSRSNAPSDSRNGADAPEGLRPIDLWKVFESGDPS